MSPPTKKLLIADDEPAIRMLIVATLGSESFEIFEAETGSQAMEIAEREQPALALLDVHMPGLSGIEVCRRIRASSELADTKVIILTGDAASADREAGLAAGADTYLTKPFSPLQLIETIERAVS